MKTIKAVVCFGLMMCGVLMLGGCALPAEPSSKAGLQLAGRPPVDPPAAAAPAATRGGDVPVARVNGVVIQMQELESLLIESHGLSTLLSLVQLELARQAAAEKKLIVGQADFDHERKRTLDRLFEEYDAEMDEKVAAARKAGQTDVIAKLESERIEKHTLLLEQFLAQERITSGEFDIVLRTNAHLRKVAEPLLEGKITDELLHKQYDARYGALVRIRHIQLARVQDVFKAKGRLAAGEDFGKIATDMSTNPQTGPQGGLVPDFSANTPSLPKNFKDAAFALKEGEVSEVVEAGNTFHLIKLEKRITPKAVPFESVKQSIYNDLHEQYTQAIIKELRARIAERARESLTINDPTIKKQYNDKLALAKTQADAKTRAMEDLQHERDRAATQPIGPPSPLSPVTTRPAATQPTTTGLTLQERIKLIREQRLAELAAAGDSSLAPATRPTTAPAPK